LVTRPEPEARALARGLEGLGLEVVIEPMLEIVFRAPGGDGSEGGIALGGLQAVLVTSANGARALARASERRDIPVFAVGRASGRAAREAGFGAVEEAGGDVTALARLVSDKLDPAKGALLHAAGAKLAGDLRGVLEARGFTVRRQVLYEARAAGALSAKLRETLAGGGIDLALFVSPRSAGTFVSLLRGAGLASVSVHIHAFCLSAAVAEALEGLSWRRVWTAPRPEQDALLATVERALESL
jgi:uroporphyrinogen-III synthase